VANPERDPLVGSMVDGRYRIVSRIAAGGMGVVYRAEQVFLRREVALKRLHRDLTGHGLAMERFKREARAAVQINHPNVCQVLDCGVDGDGTLFIAMELLDGQSLAQRIADYAPLPLDEIVDLGSQIADGLQQAHALGIVHRDLKPENVMLVTRPDGSGVTAKILDFGVAKTLHDADAKALTQAGMVFGTPKYMAPEQASGEALDARADLYSLGVILFELATGRPPFDGPTAGGVMARHLTATPPTLESAAPHLSYPLAFRELVGRCLVKDPNHRIPTAQALAEALRTCRGQRVSLVGPPVPRPGRDDVPTVAAGTGPPTPLFPAEPASTGFDQLALGGPTRLVPQRKPKRAVLVAAAVLLVCAVAGVLLLRSGSEDDERSLERDAGAALALAPGALGPLPSETGSPTPDADAASETVPLPDAVDAQDVPAAEASEAEEATAKEDTALQTRQEAARAAAEERRTFEEHDARVLAALAKVAGGDPAGGLADLEGLATELDGNAHFHFHLAVLLVGAQRFADAIGQAQRVLELDPRYAGEPELQAVAEQCLLQPASVDAAVQLLYRIADEALAERLVRFVLDKTRSVATPKRVRELLAQRGLLDGVPEYLRLPLLVIADDDCEPRRAVLEQIAARPDARMATFLDRFHATTGCGPRRRRDCWPCERSALQAALAAVEAAPPVD
jgi:tRNA A-37 threonylcarbamoyl transferase component Bud32